MGYRLLGFVVWQGAKWWMRRKLPGRPAGFVLAGAGVAVAAGVLAAGRRAGTPE